MLHVLHFRVVVITDRSAAARRGRGVIDTVARALADPIEGVAVLVRDRGRPIDDVRATCAALLPICRRAGAALLVHTHLALVDELGLDGAHLTSDAAASSVVPTRAGRRGVLGASRHGSAGLDDDNLDYAFLSPVFAPHSKVDARPTLGVEGLAPLARGARVPVLALGGVDVDNAAACVRAGAAGVAAIGAVMSAVDPRRALRALVEQTAASAGSAAA